MFQGVPEETSTVKGGRQKTQARYFVENSKNVREMLKSFAGKR